MKVFLHCYEIEFFVESDGLLSFPLGSSPQVYKCFVLRSFHVFLRTGISGIYFFVDIL